MPKFQTKLWNLYETAMQGLGRTDNGLEGWQRRKTKIKMEKNHRKYKNEGGKLFKSRHNNIFKKFGIQY